MALSTLGSQTPSPMAWQGLQTLNLGILASLQACNAPMSAALRARGYYLCAGDMRVGVGVCALEYVCVDIISARAWYSRAYVCPCLRVCAIFARRGAG
jgi:hypothetical protein